MRTFYSHSQLSVPKSKLYQVFFSQEMFGLMPAAIIKFTPGIQCCSFWFEHYHMKYFSYKHSLYCPLAGFKPLLLAMMSQSTVRGVFAPLRSNTSLIKGYCG